MNFCVDCKFSRPSLTQDVKHTTCCFTYPGEYNPVSGEPKLQEFEYCSVLRNSKSEILCGPEGRFFEAKT
jgi:hypothetical protein